MSKAVVGTFVLWLGLVTTGCGRRDMGRVEGWVSFQGSPVPDAVVNFQPTNQPMASGKTDADGHFVLNTFAKGDGSIGGQCQVTISPHVELPDLYATGPSRPAPPKPRPDIPEVYRAPSTSPLTAEVLPGRRNSFEFALEEQPADQANRASRQN